MPSINTMSSEQKQLYSEIQDIIGPAHLWPRDIHKWFLFGVPQGEGISRRLRPIVAAFFWINGLNPLVFIEWCKMSPLCHPRKAQDHYMWLFDSFDRGYQTYRYAWNVTLGHYQNMDGSACDVKARHSKTF